VSGYAEWNMKKKLPTTRYFLKSFTELLTGRITAREALIYGIVSEFEENNAECFISRQELAKRINESEATAERAVQLLIKEGWLKSKRDGRKRYLYTSRPNAHDLYQPDTDETHDLYQNRGRSVSKSGFDLYQPDTLIRSINQINNQINSKLDMNKVNKAAERFGLKKRF